MKKSKIRQNKKYTVELMLMHEQVDRVIMINVVAFSTNDAKAHALRVVRDTYSEKAEAVCEIRDIKISE